MPALILSSELGELGMRAAAATMTEHAHALDAVQAGIMPVEADPSVPYVGVGGAPNMLGELETDAALMCGDTFRVGVVGALKGFRSAVWVAREVLNELPHTMLVGEGARRFAMERGAEVLGALPEHVQHEYQQWLLEHLPEHKPGELDNVALAPFTWPSPASEKKDTVVFLARNTKGSFAGGTSTSGWCYKYPGRLGDSPIIGAGLYVDSKYGACTCTHTGEMTMRAGTARAVVAYLQAGAAVKDACHEAVNDLRRLRGGYHGTVVIHALSAEGTPYVVATAEENVSFWLWDSESDQVIRQKAVLDLIELRSCEANS